MSLTAIKNKVTSKVGRQVLVAQKHSPTMLVGVGVIGMAATVFLACRATLKMEEAVREAEQKIVEQGEDQNRKVNIELGMKVAKLYAPAVIVGVATVTAITGSHVLLSRRNVAVTAAYAALDKGFKEYRTRVVEEFGQEKDDEFRFGSISTELAVDTDEGVAIQTVNGADPTAFTEGRSIYARIFGEGFSTNYQPVTSYNQVFLKAQENYANDLLQARGHLFLNEVYDMLGFSRTTEGSVVGWVKGHGDDYVTFGIFDDLSRGTRFVKGMSATVVLDFNVDGVIYDKI